MNLAPQIKASKHTRIPQLDGVRALAIGAVFLHHSLHIRLMWMGVDLFFILSGFLITGILLQHRTQGIGDYFRNFYKRRARRILPPYILLMIVTTIFFGIAWMRHAYLYLVLMNFILACMIPQPESLSVLWSLAVEEQFYLVWPFAVYLLSEIALGWTAAILILLVPVLRWACTPLFAHHWPIYSLTPFRMDLLLVGALLAIAWRQHRGVIERYGHFGLALPPLAGAVLYYMTTRYHISTFENTRLSNVAIYELSLVACAGIILWALSGRWVGVLTLPPITYLGRISYSIYLIHLTMLVLAEQWLPHSAAAVPFAIAATLIYAALSWHFLELPLLGSKPREASVVLANN